MGKCKNLHARNGWRDTARSGGGTLVTRNLAIRMIDRECDSNRRDSQKYIPQIQEVLLALFQKFVMKSLLHNKKNLGPAGRTFKRFFLAYWTDDTPVSVSLISWNGISAQRFAFEEPRSLQRLPQASLRSPGRKLYQAELPRVEFKFKSPLITIAIALTKYAIWSEEIPSSVFWFCQRKIPMELQPTSQHL